MTLQTGDDRSAVQLLDEFERATFDVVSDPPPMCHELLQEANEVRETSKAVFLAVRGGARREALPALDRVYKASRRLRNIARTRYGVEPEPRAHGHRTWRFDIGEELAGDVDVHMVGVVLAANWLVRCAMNEWVSEALDDDAARLAQICAAHNELTWHIDAARSVLEASAG